MASRRRPVLHGALVGAFAGALAGVADGGSAWGQLAQFAPAAATRARTVAYLMSTYALVGCLAGIGVAIAWRVLRWALSGARGGGLAASAVHAAALAPLCGVAVWLAHRGLVHALAHRKHRGLMIASAQAVTIVALAAAVAAGVVIAGAIVRLVWPRRAAPPDGGGESGAALARVLAFLPLVAIAILVAHALVLDRITIRHTPRQIVTATITTTLIALALAVAAATGLAMLLTRVLAGRAADVALRLRGASRRYAQDEREVVQPAAAVDPHAQDERTTGGAARLDARHERVDAAAPLLAAWVIFVIAAIGYHLYARDTLALVRARLLYIGLVAIALTLPAWPLARLAARRLTRRTTALTAALAAALLLLSAVTGNRAAVVKAAIAYGGGGDVITRGLTFLFDADRDGHSALFGGDDCDDLDASIHPGASDIPDDGVDQNCVAGDAHVARSADDVGMIPLPPGVPADANIILLTIDTLRADHLGSYGYRRDTSPNLDALAAAGARFAHGWAHAPSTRYSMPAILTGRLPLDVDYDYNAGGWPGLSLKATTIAELLQPRGFTTAAFTNYWYFDRSRHMDQGFAIYDNENAKFHQGADPAHTHGSSSAQQTDKALAFLDAHGHERFFLWVHYYDVHHEYEVHPEVPSFGDAPVDRYDGEIRFTDLHVGRLLDDLRARGLWEKTVIVVTGDHGEGFGEHAIDFHGYDLYGPQTRVPLIIRVPGVAPRVVDTAAGHVDIMPTLANLAGVPASPQMMGRSLLDWIAGTRADDPERVVFQQVQYEGDHDKRGAASARCHVLYDISPHTAWQVYDVERDPGETRDISGAPGRCVTTRRAFERWFDSAQIPAGAADALLSGPPDIAHPLDVDLGPEVRLLAVDLPAEVHPGQPFDITWTFAARGRLPDGWKVFVHFENGKGGRFTADHPPARPFAWWRAGQFVRYTISATVPASAPTGDYALWTGLWRKQARRPITAPPGLVVVDNRAKVATVRVVRP